MKLLIVLVSLIALFTRTFCSAIMVNMLEATLKPLDIN